MQVMPETAKWIMGKEVNLFEPKTNIYVGCKYFGFLQSEFLDLPTTLSAYNAGPNKTKVWLEDERYSTASRTMRKTPYKETNNSIKKVLSSQKIYKFLYKF